MAEKKKATRRRRRSIAGFNNMTYLAGAVGLWGPMALDRLPHSFETEAAGKGAPWWKNKRVLIVLAALIFCIQHDSLKVRLWSIPLTALLSLAVVQHKATYEVGYELEERFDE